MLDGRLLSAWLPLCVRPVKEDGSFREIHSWLGILAGVEETQCEGVAPFWHYYRKYGAAVLAVDAWPQESRKP